MHNKDGVKNPNQPVGERRWVQLDLSLAHRLTVKSFDK